MEKTYNINFVLYNGMMWNQFGYTRDQVDEIVQKFIAVKRDPSLGRVMEYNPPGGNGSNIVIDIKNIMAITYN